MEPNRSYEQLNTKFSVFWSDSTRESNPVYQLRSESSTTKSRVHQRGSKLIQETTNQRVLNQVNY